MIEVIKLFGSAPWALPFIPCGIGLEARVSV